MFDLATIPKDYSTIFDSLDISESTRTEYIARLPHFLEWLQQNTFTIDSLLQYKKYLRDRTDLGVASKNKYLAVARTCLKELHRRGVLPVDVTSNVKSFSQSKKHKVTGLDDNDVAKLTAYLRSLEPTKQNLRLKAIVALLLYQGLRQIEVVRLNVQDLELSSRRAYVQGKGRIDKEPIDLHPETVAALQNYLDAHNKSYGPLFTPITRKDVERLTTRGLRKIVQKVLSSTKINRTVHGFRHYYTTKLISAYRGDLLRVSCYTRHRSVEMLQVYNDNLLTLEDLSRYYAVFTSIKL